MVMMIDTLNYGNGSDTHMDMDIDIDAHVR